jgi:hypothetical protein
MARKSEVEIMAETLLATKGAAALTVARRRFYASRRRHDERACYVWLRVADAIRLAGLPGPPRPGAEAAAPREGEADAGPADAPSPPGC